MCAFWPFCAHSGSIANKINGHFVSNTAENVTMSFSPLMYPVIVFYRTLLLVNLSSSLSVHFRCVNSVNANAQQLQLSIVGIKVIVTSQKPELFIPSLENKLCDLHLLPVETTKEIIFRSQMHNFVHSKPNSIYLVICHSCVNCSEKNNWFNDKNLGIHFWISAASSSSI